MCSHSSQETHGTSLCGAIARSVYRWDPHERIIVQSVVDVFCAWITIVLGLETALACTITSISLCSFCMLWLVAWFQLQSWHIIALKSALQSSKRTLITRLWWWFPVLLSCLLGDFLVFTHIWSAATGLLLRWPNFHRVTPLVKFVKWSKARPKGAVEIQ